VVLWISKNPKIFLETRTRDQVKAASVCTRLRARLWRASRVGADNSAEEEEVILMKFTQNAVTFAVHRLVGRLCQTPRRFTETPYNRIAAASVGICILLVGASAFAQDADNIADREVQRRQTVIPAGEAALARGNSAMRAKNYTVAYQEFKTAVAYLPDAVVSGKAHDEAAEGACKSGTA